MSNNSQIAFAPLGKTVVIAANPVAPAGLQVPVRTQITAQAVGQYRFVNNGSALVHIGAGPTAALATAAAVAATAGTPGAGIPLVAGAVEILRFSVNAYFSAVTTVAGTVYVTPGEGL